MMPFQLQTLKKKIEEIRAQSAAELEAVCNMARLQHDYRRSQLDNLLKLCDHVQTKKINVPSDV